MEQLRHILDCCGPAILNTRIDRAEGCYLYDDAGRRYVDFEAGVWCTSLGHNHPRVNRVIRDRLERISHLSARYLSPILEDAARSVLAITGMPDGKVNFLLSGSEAVEFGVQLARHLTRKPLLFTFADSFLGSYGAGQKRPDEWHCFDRTVCSACPHPGECDPGCPHLAAVPWEQIGGMALEPGGSKGLVRLPEKPLVQTLARLIRARGGLILVNEVTTGIGRTGEWFGYNHYGLEPDIVAMGKGIGNGYPVSVTALGAEVAARAGAEGFRYYQSHQNDAMGAAVAREVIAVIREEGLIDRSRRVGTEFRTALERLGERREGILEVRGRGLMMAVVLAGGEGPLAPAAVHQGLYQRGFFCGFSPAADLIRFYPALNIPEAEIDRLIGALDEILAGFYSGD